MSAIRCESCGAPASPGSGCCRYCGSLMMDWWSRHQEGLRLLHDIGAPPASRISMDGAVANLRVDGDDRAAVLADALEMAAAGTIGPNAIRTIAQALGPDAVEAISCVDLRGACE